MYALLKDKKLFILSLLILIAVIVCIIGSFTNAFLTVRISKTLIVIFTFVLYLVYREKGTLFLGIFLCSMSLSELLLQYYYFFKDANSILMLNVLTVVTYMSLFNHLIANIKISVLFTKYLWQSLLAFVIGVFAFVKLNELLNFHNMMFNDVSFVVDISYNIFIILILIFSFLFYIYYRNKKALFLFLGSFGIALSNFIEVVSYYTKEFAFQMHIFNAILFCASFYFLSRFITYEYSKFANNR